VLRAETRAEWHVKGKAMKNPTSVLRTGLLVCCVPILTGCGTLPTGRFIAFQTSTQDIVSKASDTYARIEKLQGREMVIRAYSKDKLDSDSFAPIRDGKDFSIGPRLELREYILGVIEKYATALSALALKDYESDLDKASQDLGASVKGLGISSGNDIPMAAGVISTAVDEIARSLTFRLRKHALKEVMEKTQEPLGNLATRLEQDQDLIKQFVGTIRIRVQTFSASVRPKFGTVERYKFDGEMGDMLLEISAVEKALDGISKAVVAIPPAHRDLLTSLDNNKQDLNSLRGLIAEAQRVQKFYRDLPQK